MLQQMRCTVGIAVCIALRKQQHTRPYGKPDAAMVEDVEEAEVRTGAFYSSFEKSLFALYKGFSIVA